VSDAEDTGKPQGATTGRWEILAKPTPPKKRWNEVPMWYRVLDRFGLPTLFAIALLLGGYKVGMRLIQSMETRDKGWQATFERLSDKIERVIFVPAPQPVQPPPLKPEPARKR